MACSKYELGYEESRFEIVVSQRFHCPICFLVLKDPVMCKNEHYYCSFCIKKHLENSSFCPTCREPLTVNTLKPAPRIVKDYISELNIHCDFQPRGCPEMVQVGHLERHVASCGFSPVQCSNNGCNDLLNAKDQLHHEAEVCDFRKPKCHDCGQLKNEMKEMKDEMMRGQDRVKNETKEMKNEMKVMIDQVLVCQGQMQSEIVSEMKQEVKEQIRNEMKNEVGNMKAEIKSEVKGMIANEMRGMKVEVKGEIKGEVNKMQEEMKNEMRGMKVEVKGEIKGEVNKMKEEMKNEMRGMKVKVKGEIKGEVNKMQEEMKNEMRGMKVEVKGEIKGEVDKMKEEMKNEMKEIVVNAMRDAMAGMKGLEVEMKNSKQSSQATCSSDARENIFLVGGYHVEGGRIVRNKSTECFNWADQTWTLLESAVFKGRSRSCSFLYQGQMVVAGGDADGGNETNTMKCLNVADPSATWKYFAAKLPVRCSGHKVVNHNDQLFMSGGYVQDRFSDCVNEVQLVPPYSSKMLTRLPQPRCWHAMEMFDQKLFILGGIAGGGKVTASVVQYDLVRNECKEMPPLPHPVTEMATFLWRNNVLVIGGRDERDAPLNKVVMYDVISGRSQMLPCMKQKRVGCTAVLTGNVVVVMGGRNEKRESLKSVESFDLERQVWQDLPDMLEPRVHATAVVTPNQ